MRVPYNLHAVTPNRPRRVVPTDDDRRDINLGLIDKPFFEERAEQLLPCLRHHLHRAKMP